MAITPPPIQTPLLGLKDSYVKSQPWSLWFQSLVDMINTTIPATYVPYNGATKNVNLNNNSLTIGVVSSSALRFNEKLEVAGAGGSTYSGVALTNWESGGRSPILDFNSASSDTPGTMTAKGNGDNLAVIAFRGADGTNFIYGAHIQATTNGTISTGHMPTDLKFYTSSASVQDNLVMTLGATGAVTIPAYGSGGGLISVGAADSGGTGYRVLRVPN